jgi:hypothetical protein
MWAFPQADGEYAARMEVYSTSMPKRPVICFDESPTQLIGEAHQPIATKPGQPKRYDYEYKRNGTTNLFVFLDRTSPVVKGQSHHQPNGCGLRGLHARSHRCSLS